ncbi:protein kinase PINOID [Lotus japonicus]|uniref:protein kinase PINOID n=1 Tax=Lotus japonicus TaxID=34305 RepID=UPI0025909995|nr:protein kinase PINOID [Lotus japonicus]
MFETGSSGRDSGMSLETSTQRTSMSSGSDSGCSTSFSRLSFDLLRPSSPPESLSVKPHRSSDFAYSAIRRKTSLTFRDFHLLRRIGSGDIGTVYLCRLRAAAEEDDDDDDDDDEPASCFYAMKVVDKEAVALKKKAQRAEMERKILKMLDHPFLPSLYAEFEASHFSCIVMEFCSGGDLHSLRHRLPHNRFSLSSARFYAAEVLVALEYLHMLGIIYRDLKPENVLVRSDGHIMLSDFDLSLCSDATPAVESSDYSFPPEEPSCTRHNSTPFFSCLSNRLFRSRKVQTVQPNRLFVAEPVGARSCSFVGTHEYVSPEVASGNSHGNAVDWWSFGIFIYEMVYGRTPFAGPSNDVTLRSILKKPLVFPTATPSSALEMHARDLISGLLNKDPNRRLGSMRGAADVKKHPFFAGINLALIRMVAPPEVPSLRRQKTTPVAGNRNNSKQQAAASFDYF